MKFLKNLMFLQLLLGPDEWYDVLLIPEGGSNSPTGYDRKTSY